MAKADARSTPTVLHAWGPAACAPEGDAALIDGAGAAPDVVITPSNWGGRRRELFAQELVRRGFDPRIGDLATELMGLERPSVAHSILVEVEAGRICVSRLVFDAGLADSRLSFRGGDALEIIREVAAELLAGADVVDEVLDTSDVEFIVASGSDHLVADMRRRGWLAFPVPMELVGTASRDDASAHPLRPGADRDVVSRQSASGRPVAGGAGSERPGSGRAVADDAPQEAGADGGLAAWGLADGGLDVAALRRRARARENTRRRPSHPAQVMASVAGAVVACVLAVTAIALIVDGPVGTAWRDDAVLAAAAGDGSGGPNGGEPDPGDAAGSGPGDGPHAGTHSEAGADPGADADAGAHGGPDTRTEPKSAELAGKGVRVELPDGWRIDDRAAADGLVLVDGGPMRILVSAGEVAWGMDAEGIVAGLTAHAAGDPTMDRVRRETIEGLDVVVHEERPDDGSVVLWQHRLIDGWQVSVGCQFRGATIPQVRPVCGQALRTAGVAAPQ
ncbi:type VII secretion-associated protein [Corynebacterium sp. NPDC060344]|uniref:type VII secretion-associated protein n=1 Tax=Corynebacterium sp. NPDC060344 TaxID=3347101 RepID=UPI00364B5C09